MPRHEDIEQFKRVLASYGAGPSGRPGTPASRQPAPTEPESGEPPGSAGESGDLADLAEPGGAAESPPAASEEAPEASQDGAPPDIGDLLSSLPGELAGGPSSEAVPGDENLDLSALFGEEEDRAIRQAAEPSAPARRGRERKQKPPRAAKAPKQRRTPQPEPQPEPQPSPEEAAALEELAAPEAAPEAVPEAEPLAQAEVEELGALEELSAAEETLMLPSAEEPAAPVEEPAVPVEEPTFFEEAEPDATPPTAPAEAEQILEEPPEFLEAAEPLAEAATPVELSAEEALLRPLGVGVEPRPGVDVEPRPGVGVEPRPGVDEETPSLTGDLEQFEVLPEEAAPAGPEGGTGTEPDLSSFEPGVTPAELPEIGDLDELTLPEQGGPASKPTPQPAALAAPRPAPRGEAPRRAPRLERPARERPRAPTPEGPGAVPPAPGAEAIPVGDIQLTDEQFDRLRRTLGDLPRNLKIAVQDIVAGAAAPTADLAALIGLLVSGAGPREIAALAGKMTGKRIRIPAAYERRTGRALEREQRTFAYAFRRNILPLVRLFAIAVLGAGLAGYLGYRFVWQPLSAATNYRRGFEQLEAGRYPLANERFTRAARAWPMRRWFYRYAEAFREKRQYDLAAEKYEDLLGRWPNDRKAVLDWAAMESTQRSRYEEADKILHRILDRRPTDYDALLAAGDNFLEWATREGEAARFEDARLSWAELIAAHGTGNAVLYRMLRYFVRTDNLEEAERLRGVFFARRRFKLDTEGARSFAELGGYLVDKRQLDWVHDILAKAASGDPQLPEVPYQFAKFYRAMEQPQLEEQSLASAISMIERSKAARTVRDIEMQIDVQTRLGELYYEARQYLEAARELKRAVTLVEKDRAEGAITDAMLRQPRFGRLLGRPSARLADISYYIEGDLAAAADGYRTAAGYGYAGPEIDYKLGYISYATGDWLTALQSFSAAEEGLARAAFAAPGDEAVGTRAASAPGRVPLNLLFAQGNAFYRRGDLFAAQGSWLRVLEQVRTRIAAFGELSPLTRPDHRALLEYRLKADNNLGVATAQLAGRTGDRRRTSEALAYLAEAAETADLLARAPETLVASEAKSLPALNMRGVMYPLANFELQIYKAIPKDLEATSF